MSRRLWITGAAGFTGRHMIAFMRSLPDTPRLVGVDVCPDRPSGLDAYHACDLGHPGDLAPLVEAEPPSWVIHLAGIMPPAAEPLMWQANVGGTTGLLEAIAAGRATQCRVLVIGSAAEYIPRDGEALTEESPCGCGSAYGRSKWAQTLVAIELSRRLGLRTSIARPFNLIGPGLPSRLVAGALCEQFTRPGAEEILVGNLNSARDFVDVRDVVRAFWDVVQVGGAGEIYNVCTGTPQTVEHLLALMAELSGRSPRIRTDPGRIRASDPAVSYGTCAKLTALTGWRPACSLRDSVAAMLGTQAGSGGTDHT